jgi:hypothetical protein
VTARRIAPVRRSFLARLAEGDTYGTLLILIVVAYALMAVVEDTRWARTIIGASFGATLLLALHTSHVRGKAIRVAWVLVIVLVGWSAALAIADVAPFTGATHLSIILITIAPVVILARIFRHPVINVETILGAIDAYLLLGISFAAVYTLMDEIDAPFFVQGEVNPVRYLYFSFVVLTTVGFGDLTPRTDIAGVVVTLEALFGQIFLVTIVAVLVANMGRARMVVSTGRGSHAVADPADDLPADDPPASDPPAGDPPRAP